MGTEKELSLRDILDIHAVTKSIEEQDLPFGFGYRIGRLFDRVEKPVKRFTERKEQLIIKKYGTKDEKGNYNIVEREKQNAFNEELKEMMMNEKEAIKVPDFEWKDIQEIEKSKPVLWGVLLPFVKGSEPVQRVERKDLTNEDMSEILRGIATVANKDYPTNLSFKFGEWYYKAKKVADEMENEAVGKIKKDGKKTKEGTYSITDEKKKSAYKKWYDKKVSESANVEGGLPVITLEELEPLKLPVSFSKVLGKMLEPEAEMA